MSSIAPNKAFWPTFARHLILDGTHWLLGNADRRNMKINHFKSAILIAPSLLFSQAAWGMSNGALAVAYAFRLTESQYSNDDLVWVDDLTQCNGIKEAIPLIPPKKGEEEAAIAGNKAAIFPSGSYFLVRSRHIGDDGKADYWIVSTVGVDGFSENLYKMCLGLPQNSPTRYYRTGGLDTGLLVVPFKLRGHEISGDATIGPYIGFRTEYLRIPLSFGLSQLSIGGTTVTSTDNTSGVTTVTTSGVESTTGITLATGLIFSVNPTFDVGALVGWDWALGEDRKRFHEQGKVWFSFGIGINFTGGKK